MDDDAQPLLALEEVSVTFALKKEKLWERACVLRAVIDVNLEVKKGEILGIVGESGCGKSTLARAIVGLAPLSGGNILYEGRPLRGLGDERSIQMIFQNPYGSLSPRLTVYETLAEAVQIGEAHHCAPLAQRVTDLLMSVGLDGSALSKYPHEFSGGQCQRIAIARVLATRPKVIIADEIVSALDVSVQAQILNLLRKLVDELNLTLVFISHDLSVMKYLTDRIAVMYLGRIVELGATTELFDHPLHPYTQALVGAMRSVDDAERVAFKAACGEPASAINPPSGCAFHPRCPYAREICHQEVPALRACQGSEVACVLYEGALVQN